MSNIVRFENLKQIVTLAEKQFDELAVIHGAVNYKREAAFAMQILEESEYLSGIALKNQDSLKNAILNVAAIGLTLSPVHKLAYLIPRKGKVCLDISYQGLKQLSIDCGAINFCHADVVYANDEFLLRGVDKEPRHNFKPFDSNRGEKVGAYCVAKTPAGDFITTIMDIEEIYKIREKSESYAKKSGPWVSDENEMIKKTLVRRAYKSWPKPAAEKVERLAKAIDIEDDVIDTTSTKVIDLDPQREGKLNEIRDSLKFLERSEDQYIKHLCNVNRREIKNLEDLTDIEISQSKVMLMQWTDQKKKRDESEKVKNENAGADPKQS